MRNSSYRQMGLDMKETKSSGAVDVKLKRIVQLARETFI